MSDTFAVKEPLDITVFAYAASGYGNALFTVDYAKQTNISTTAERLPIRGGIGNFKLLDLDHSKDCTASIILPLVDINALAVKLGVSAVTGAATATKKESLTASETNTLTLAATPLANTLKIYALVNERDLGTEQTAGSTALENKYSISNATITLNSTTGASGNKFLVFYEYTSGTAAQNLKITASDFPNFITVVGKGLVDDDQEGQKIPISFKIHKAKVQPGFQLTMEGSSSTEIDFTLDCYTIINSAGDREYVNVVLLEDEAY